MSEAKPYTREELATISHGDTEFSYDQCPECGQDCGRWLATLAAVEAERDGLIAGLESIEKLCTHEDPIHGTCYSPGGMQASVVLAGSNRPMARVCAARDAALAEVERLREALAQYGGHERDCIRSRWEAGWPTPGGGYETCYAGQWYESRPVDRTPPCTCGFDAALAPQPEVKGEQP